MAEEESTAAETASLVTHDPVVVKASQNYLVLMGKKSDLPTRLLLMIVSILGITASFWAGSYIAEPADGSVGYYAFLTVIKMAALCTFTAVLCYQLVRVVRNYIFIVDVGGFFLNGLLKENALLIALVPSFVVCEYALSGRLVGSLLQNPEERGAAKAATPAERAAGAASFLSTTDACNSIITKVFGALLSVVIIWLIKALFIHVLNYNIHRSYYSDRIEKNTRRINLVQRLNALAHATFKDMVSEVVTKIFTKLGNGTEHLNEDAFRPHLSDEEIGALRDYLDTEKEIRMSREDMEEFYLTTITEQKHLSVGLLHMNGTVAEFNYVASFIAFVLSCILFSRLMQFEHMGTEKAAVIMSGIVSGGYIFADIIKNFISSIQFVFFVRPFEANDFIMVEGQLYKVKEITLLVSLLYKDSLLVSYPNSQLLGKPITNYRASHAHDVRFNYTFSADAFLKKKQELLDKIQKYAGEKKVILGSPYFEETRHVSAKAISTVLVVAFNLNNVSMKRFNIRREDFTKYLHEKMGECGLTPFA